MKFIVDAKIGSLSPEIVKQIISNAVSYYMEEHLVETNAAYRELSDEEACDWSFKIKEM